MCFTTHYDSNPNSLDGPSFISINGKRKPATPENLKPYVDDVKAAADKFFSLGLIVKLGVEFGWYSHCEEAVAALQNQFQFDYMLCGHHELDNLCFCYHKTATKSLSRFSVEEAVQRYTDDIVAAANCRLFQTIAHLDRIRAHGVPFYGLVLDDLLLQSAKDRVFPVLIETGTCIEVNTSGMRQSLKDYYPRIKLINAARRAGVDIRYLGSDAHTPEDVGADFDQASALVTPTGSWEPD